VIGLGYVGLPLVELFAAKGFPVLGFDVDVNKVERLQAGQSYIGHIASERVIVLRDSGHFEATPDFTRLVEADAILICVPTPPLGLHREPDLSAVIATGRSIGQSLRPGQLVVLESTTYPGTTRDVLRPELEAGGAVPTHDHGRLAGTGSPLCPAGRRSGTSAAARRQLQLSKALVAAREITSPHDGVVVEIYKNTGEAIMAGSPIFKVVKVDRMRVTGYLDASDACHVRPKQTVRVMPELEGVDLPIEREVFEGQITFVDSEIDPKTRTCRVFAEVENRGGLLRSGLDCRMEIDLRNPSGMRAEATGWVLSRPADTEAQPRSVPRTSGEGLAQEGRER